MFHQRYGFPRFSYEASSHQRYRLTRDSVSPEIPFRNFFLRDMVSQFFLTRYRFARVGLSGNRIEDFACAKGREEFDSWSSSEPNFAPQTGVTNTTFQLAPALFEARLFAVWLRGARFSLFAKGRQCSFGEGCTLLKLLLRLLTLRRVVGSTCACAVRHGGLQSSACLKKIALNPVSVNPV